MPSASVGELMAHPLWQIQLDLVFNVGAVNELRSTGDVLLMGPVARHCRGNRSIPVVCHRNTYLVYSPS